MRRSTAPRIDASEIFVELFQDPGNRRHSMRRLNECMTIHDLFTKTADRLRTETVERMYVEFKDEVIMLES